jgi:hypothetical protein
MIHIPQISSEFATEFQPQWVFDQWRDNSTLLKMAIANNFPKIENQRIIAKDLGLWGKICLWSLQRLFLNQPWETFCQLKHEWTKPFAIDPSQFSEYEFFQKFFEFMTHLKINNSSNLTLREFENYCRVQNDQPQFSHQSPWWNWCFLKAKYLWARDRCFKNMPLPLNDQHLVWQCTTILPGFTAGMLFFYSRENSKEEHHFPSYTLLKSCLSWGQEVIFERPLYEWLIENFWQHSKDPLQEYELTVVSVIKFL